MFLAKQKYIHLNTLLSTKATNPQPGLNFLDPATLFCQQINQMGTAASPTVSGANLPEAAYPVPYAPSNRYS